MIDNLFPDVNIQAFIGIRKLGTWQWLGGKNISTNIWHHGYPDALWSGECGALVRGSLKWKLLQTSCFYTLGYICETDESKCLCMVSVIVWLYYLRINPSANKDSPFIDFLHEWIHLTEKMTPKSQVTCQMNVNSLVIVKYHISLVCSQLSFSSFLSFNKKGVMFSVMYEEVHLVKGLNDYDIQEKWTLISHFQCYLPLSQNESWCPNFHIKVTNLICKIMNAQKKKKN